MSRTTIQRLPRREPLPPELVLRCGECEATTYVYPRKTVPSSIVCGKCGRVYDLVADTQGAA